MPDLPKSAEYITDGTTFVNPLGMAFTLVMCILIVVLPRRHAWLPVILTGVVSTWTSGLVQT